MKRRDMLKAISMAALSYIPANAESAWQRLADGYTLPPATGLTAAQLTLVGALSDAIIPRTDTPGATDVGVPAWVNLIVTEYYTDAERDPFVSGLDAIDAFAVRDSGTAFASLSPQARDHIMSALDKPADRNTLEARAYSRLKGLAIHGYFTSERVQKEVLKTQIMPMRYDGAAPHVVPIRGK
jgi:hypothetical protein